MHEYSPPPLAIYRWRADVLPERVWGQQQLLARRLRKVPHPFPSRARVELRFALFFAHARH